MKTKIPRSLKAECAIQFAESRKRWSETGRSYGSDRMGTMRIKEQTPGGLDAPDECSGACN